MVVVIVVVVVVIVVVVVVVAVVVGAGFTLCGRPQSLMHLPTVLYA